LRTTTEYRTVRRNWPLARGDVERPRGVWGWPGRGAPPVRLSRTVDAYPAPGRGRRRGDAARLHIKLWRVVADIDPPRSDVDPLARSASRDAAEAHHGWNLSAPPICVHHLYGHAFCWQTWRVSAGKRATLPTCSTSNWHGSSKWSENKRSRPSCDAVGSWERM